MKRLTAPDVPMLRIRGGHPTCIGYARVSTPDQSLDGQIEALTKAGCCKIFYEKVSGVSTHRPAFAAMLQDLRKGDSVIVTALDRLGRNITEVIGTLEFVHQMGAFFRDLHHNIDTRSQHGKVVAHLIIVLAASERELTRERTKTGLAAARAQGRKGGRPRLVTGAKREQIYYLRRKNYSLGQIAETVHLSERTVRRVLGDMPVKLSRQLELSPRT